MTWEVRQADCVEAMAAMDAASVDAVVCDPPYGLGFMGKEWDSAQALASRPPSADEIDARFNNAFPRTGKGPAAVAFDGHGFQSWCQAWATEALRVLKPGGHLLAFGGTRTSHRLACAIEDAGFEIRDTISWLYGSGFPKSLDVLKAIDKANGRRFEDRYELGRHIKERREAAGLSRTEVSAAVGSVKKAVHYESQRDDEATVPTLADWLVLQPLLGLSDEWFPLVERVEAERETVRIHVQSRQVRDSGYVEGSGRFLGWQHDVTAPAIPEAQQWQGWGTALKPAHEPVVVARKPLSGTVAQTVLEHGCGALNIDATRIDSSGQRPTMEAWDNEPNLCDLCAVDADGTLKPVAPETRASTAPSNAEPTTNGRGGTLPADTSKTVTGCSAGPNPEAPSTDRIEGSSFEHRRVWEDANGPVPDGYVVHHVNEVKTDNRLENLQLMRRTDHIAHHHKGKPKRKMA